MHVRGFDVAAREMKFDTTLNRDAGLSPLDLPFEKWDDIISLLAPSFPPAPDQRGSSVQGETTLTIRALPGTTLTGYREEQGDGGAGRRRGDQASRSGAVHGACVALGVLSGNQQLLCRRQQGGHAQPGTRLVVGYRCFPPGNGLSGHRCDAVYRCELFLREGWPHDLCLRACVHGYAGLHAQPAHQSCVSDGHLPSTRGCPVQAVHESRLFHQDRARAGNACRDRSSFLGRIPVHCRH